MTAGGDASTGLFEHLFRRHYAHMVAGLTRVFGPARLDLVEDVVQEALLRAMRTWPYRGVPERPAAWLTRVARNCALDALRATGNARRVEEELQRWADAAAVEPGQELPPEVADDDLRMIFTCCHPELSPESRVALTLKTLCGLGVAEIASALLAKEATVHQRLTRAKAQLREHEVTFAVPAPSELGARLETVTEVLYLMFNEGYRAHRGDDLIRTELIEESIRLASLLLDLQAADRHRVHALLALMLFQGSRLPARTTPGGEPLTLAMQDRSRWDRTAIDRAFWHFERSFPAPVRTPFHIEAAIASVHAMAPTYDATDWPRILAHYDDLAALQHSPVVALNRAVALAKVEGIERALAALDEVQGHKALASYLLLPVTRATFLWARGDHAAACEHWRAALELPSSAPERDFVLRRLRACEAGEPVPPW